MHKRMTFPSRVQQTVVLLSIIGFQANLTVQARSIGECAQDKASAQANRADVRKLEVGKPIERELKGGESHSYEIALEAGDFLNAVVEQRGIDVVVQVMGHDGKQLMEVDSPNGDRGDEPITLITEVAGVYRLKVNSLEQNAAVGKYEIRVKELRAATEADRALIEKNRALQEATSLNQEVFRHYGARTYDAALPLAERVLAIREKTLGSEHPSTFEALNNLAELYRAKGDYAKAEPLYIRSLAINEKARGAEDYDTVPSLHNLALLYRAKGDYAKAEPLYIRALAILERTLGAKHPDVAVSLNNLALLYDSKGDYAKAEPLYLRALVIFEKALGAEHPHTANSLINLAGLYRAKGDYAKAEPLMIRALTIDVKQSGAEHYDTASSLYNLALLYRAKGDYAKAEPLFIRALAITEKALGTEHPDTANSLNGLALLYFLKGDYAKAEPLFIRALAVYEKAFDTEHPDTANLFNNLALLYRAKGDYAKAVGFQSRCNDVSDRDLIRNLASGSERQKFTYLNQTSAYTDSTISLHVQSAPNDTNAKRAAIKVLLQRKGRALDAMTDAIGALRRRLSPEDQKLLNQLQDVRSQLSVLTLRGPGGPGLENHKAHLKALVEQEEKLQNDISQRSAEFRAQSQTQSKPVTIEVIQKALPPGAALIEFAQYRPVNAKETDIKKQFATPRYVAYVLRNEGEPAWVELGEANAIDSSIGVLRQALRDPNRKDVKRQARAVEEKVFHPVRKLLGDTRRVLLSPDGALNLIPFAALVDDRGQYLLAQYSFSYLTSGRDLLRLQVKTKSKQGAMVVADPDFGGDTTPCLDRKLKLSKGAVDFSQVLFCPLTGTAVEAQALKALMPDATVLMKEQATEAAVKQVAGPKTLHIATHGFFLEDVVINPATADRGSLVSVGQPGAAAMKVENPLLRSGLAMAGANLHKSGDDDGVLTALEAAGLDLWGTKLVVLSACDTGVGEVRNGDGVYGLRRALVLAGSESQVMSLWPVSDTATRDLMIGYYKGLQAGEGRGEALRQVQLRMLVSKKRQHPYYWASFIQSGEWANMEGRR